MIVKGFLWSIVGVLAFLYIVGIAGALELNTITLGEFGIRVLIGLAVFIFALYRGDKCETW